MERQRFVIMGAGTVGYYLAQTLSQQGHDVVLIELDRQRADEVEDERRSHTPKSYPPPP